MTITHEIQHPKKLIILPEKKITSLIYPTGFYKTKAKRIKEISKTLLDKYNGTVPDDFNHLFVTFGQTICVPISPFCSRCPIKHYCKRVSVTNSR